MPDPTTKTPVIPKAWLRLLLFGCTFGVVALLIGIPAILTVTGTHLDALEKDGLQFLSGLMAGDYLWLMLVLEFFTSVISVGIFRLLIERRTFPGLGWTLDGYVGEALTGFFLAPALLGLAAIALLLTGHVEWTDIIWEPTTLFISFGWMTLIAFGEELVFRGYILGNLMEWIPNKWIALGISSVLFTAYHAITPGIHTLAFVNLFLAGMLLGINYIFTRNLWFSFLLHLGWNFFEGPILGFKVSGTTFPSLFQAEPNGDLFITGGDYGLGGSMPMTLFLLVAILVLAWAFERKYQRVTITSEPEFSTEPSSPPS
jgi:membrane protease YdiL (CAAX protease family)